MEKIICGIKFGFLVEVAEEIGEDFRTLIQYGKPPACNIPSKEMKGLNTLRNDEDIVILPVDNDNPVIIMDRQLSLKPGKY